METKVYTPAEIPAAAALLTAGQLVAFPTETVYGLGADATNVDAVKQVYLAKGRPSDNPLIVHVADVETVEQFAQPLSEAAKKLIKAFWPGPLTMIFKLKPDSLAPEVTGGLQTAAFRNPDNEATLALIRAAGTPIVGPSANTSGKPSPTTAQHVLHDLRCKIAGILDDGPTKVGVESTVLDLSTDQPAILRPGAVTPEAIERVIGMPVQTELHHVGAKEVPKAPGMKYKHYAPNAQVYIVDRSEDWPEALAWAAQQDVPMGVMATDDILTNNQIPANCEQFSLGEDIQSASRELFAGLRHFDTETKIKDILCQAFENKGLGLAYMNRLNKSAGQTHFSV
ncbi:threonylcarbamoyl-AMP synthase [Lactiplantibacillus plantarum]|uniref:L-threonylcarbamoyladenylate synthase n=1 Tax=Lactiplantibacillus plantarum TaxID=1590 RepID=UPI0007BC82A1|nr:L-threonylcarbamoyladenylate synthase [Lactiplantibacillus plantarum]AYE58238.1 threonylcarbamoyl-AMP synthase [Lactiplantibacillus plantarum]KZU54739.1 TsaC protein required forthreonylcarbamoyladenosine tA37 modification in tRNA [Lactiplantibacillus plantarum]QBJ55919.1 threonylcarbamoyl-AMP synthase [Lactiplantibacillus plantarum]